MKTITLVCLILPFCYAQWVPPNILNQLQQTAKKSKDRVDTATKNIQRSKRSFIQNTESELSNILYQNSKAISDTESRRLQDIQSELEKPEAAGESVVACLHNAEYTMRSAAKTGQSNLQNCKKEGKNRATTESQVYDAAVITGGQLKNQLDMTFVECYNSNTMQMVNCITIKLGLINKDVQAFENTAKQLDRNSQQAKHNIIMSARDCYTQVVSEVNTVSRDLIYVTADCFKN